MANLAGVIFQTYLSFEKILALFYYFITNVAFVTKVAWGN